MANEPDIFSVAAQAEFVKGFGQSLPKKCNQFLNHGVDNALNAIDAIDTVGDALRRANVADEYVTAVESIKQDRDIQDAISVLEGSLEGKDNVDRLAKNVKNPEPVSKFVAFRDDPGVKREVLTGETIDGETDLVRFSNYITGPGTTVGGAAVSLPLNVADMAIAFNNVLLYKYLKFTKKLNEHDDKVLKFVEDENKYYKWLGYRPDYLRRQQRGYEVDYLDTWVSKKIKDEHLEKVVPRKRQLLLKRALLSKDLSFEMRKRKGKIHAQRRLGLLGTGVQGVTSTFGIANGVVDITAGDQIIQNAESRFLNGEINKEAYERALSDGHLRVAQGAFGIGDGMNNLRRIAMDKLSSKVKDLPLGAKRGLRFASVVGGVLSIGMGVTAVAKHSMAAQDALKSGNIGRGAMYGVMAGLDTVSVILDAVSIAFDCIPGIGTAISLAVDLVNTLVDFTNMIIGFFVDMVDTRSPELRIKEAFDAHINSSAFQAYIDRQAEVYKEQNYDLFVYMVDAKAVGIEEDDGDSSKVESTIVRKLTEKAVEDGTDKTLRKAIVDETVSDGQVLEGNLSDDHILAGVGSDKLYGLDGDDLLFGEGGNDTIYGGPGNDYLHGGTSADKLFGGPGDDFIVYEPGIDSANGGAETDTMLISADFFPESISKSAKALVLEEAGRNRVYVDLRENGNGHGGLALGALLDSFPALSNPMHQSALTPESPEAVELVGLYESSTVSDISENTLSGYYFWYLAKRGGKYYLTDGKNLYSCAESATGEMGEVKKSSYSIDSISASLAAYNETHNIMEYSGTSKLKAMFAFAFRTTSDIVGVENISVRFGSDPATAVDTSCQVIGGANTRLIDSSCGNNTYIYTGNTDTVVMVKLSDSPDSEILKYIIGGSGNNTLIINGTQITSTAFSPTRHQCILLDHDVELKEANQDSNEANSGLWNVYGDKVSRGIFIKNVQTIKFSNTASDQKALRIDGTNISTGHHFIVESNLDGFRLYGTASDDKISIKMITGTDNMIDGYKGRNMLSVESCEISGDLSIEIDEPPGSRAGSLTGGGLSVQLNNISSVRGNARTKFIGGHAEYDNLLIANGGECTVNSRGGKNSLVAMRGRHVLQGGSGNDIFEVYGPLVTEFVVVTVTNRSDEGHIPVARAMGRRSQTSVLEIPVLENDIPEVLLVSNGAKVVDATGATITNKGDVRISRDRRSITFFELSAFDSLDRNSTETVRIQYDTEGSVAIIQERTQANVLKLHGFSNMSQLKLEIAPNGDLLWKDSSNRIVLADKYWGDLFRSGVRDLNTLFCNFVVRFPTIQFNDTDSANNEMKKEEIFTFLDDQLGYLKVTANGFGNILEVKNPETNIIDARDGDNIVYGKSKNVSYRSGEGDDIFDLSKLGEGTNSDGPTTSVQTGEGDKVVIVHDNGGPVQVNFRGDSSRPKRGTKILMFKDVNENDVSVSDGPTFTVGTSTITLDSTPDMLVFSRGICLMVDDVETYLAKRKSFQPYFYKRVYNDDFEQYGNWLNTPIDSTSLQINILMDGLDINLLEGTESLHRFRMGIIAKFDLHALNIAHRFQLEFQFGINFREGVRSESGLRKLIMDCLRSSDRHTVVRNLPFLITFHASQSSTHIVHLPNGDVLVYADQDGGEIYGGVGNNLIKVTGSGQIANTGSCPNVSGHDIVHIASDAENITVELIARGDTFVLGSKFIVIEGVSTGILSVSRPTGDPIVMTPGTTFSAAPFIIEEDSRTLASFDAVPTYLFFGYAGEYEIVSNPTIFLQQKSTGSWVNRYIVSKERMILLVATDVESTQLLFDVSSISKNRTSVEFESIHSLSIALVTLEYTRGSTITKGDLAVHIATYIPGGIRFRDRTVSSDEIVSFLHGVLNKAETRFDSTMGVIGGSATDTLASMLSNRNPNSQYLDILKTCHETFRITNIDPQ